MSHTFARRIGSFLALGALLALPACDRDSVTDEDHEDLNSLEVIDRSEAGQPVVATWTLAGGWGSESALPIISLADQEGLIVLGFRAFAPDGDELELSEDGEFSIRYRVADESQDVVDMARSEDERFHGDHVHLYGAAPGTTAVHFELRHAGHVERETGAIDVTVVE